jgi:hypothetical protein
MDFLPRLTAIGSTRRLTPLAGRLQKIGPGFIFSLFCSPQIAQKQNGAA